MKLVELVWADIFRDGGSYEAEFSTDEELIYRIFLKRSAMPDEEGLHHRWLFEYRGSKLPDDCLPVITGSLEEQRLIARLDRFLKENTELNNENVNEPQNYRLKFLREMLHYIPLREPCFPGDIKANFPKHFGC